MNKIRQAAARALHKDGDKMPANTELRLIAVLHNWCADSGCYDYCGVCLKHRGME